MNEHLLEMIDICKSFVGVKVLNNINFTLNVGEVHAIIGQNGAGKSTLMKILNGVYNKDSGVIKINNKIVEYNNPIDARKHGISMIFQEFSLIPSLTVSQNVFLTKEPRIKKLFLNDTYCEKSTIDIFKSIGLESIINPKSLVENLSVGSQQLVEIAKALSKESKILIMDEPTSSLSHNEIESLFNTIRKLKSKGISIIYISHYLKDLFKICDRLTVLRDGNKIFTKKTLDTNLDELINSMTGKVFKKRLSKGKKPIDRNQTPILEVKNLKIIRSERGASFKLWPGEVLGIAGLLGSGRSEILSLIFGVNKKDKGEIFVNGKKVVIRSSKDAMYSGINMVPEDRRKQGLILDFSLKENLIITVLKKIIRFFLINDKKGVEIVKKYIAKLNIKTTGSNQIVKFLSGGNQQKVVVAKSIARESKILLLDDPTFGIDIQSKQEIMDIIVEYVSNGNSVIFVSSELDELAYYCDRILILKKGEITDDIYCNEREDISEELLLKKIQ
ncbi:MAG: sugar ABC transporter ATP-binding protein [Candidatus Humimicrobiaceae bacterium]